MVDLRRLRRLALRFGCVEDRADRAPERFGEAVPGGDQARQVRRNFPVSWTVSSTLGLLPFVPQCQVKTAWDRKSRIFL